jgi:hypothetical protein
MKKKILRQARLELGYQKKIQKIFQKQLKKETPDIKNVKYLKLLNKLDEIALKIDYLKSLIRQTRKQLFFDQTAFSRQIFVTFTSKVKLISVDFQIVLWLDAKNTSMLVGKRIGEMISLYNSQFKIAEIY